MKKFLGLLLVSLVLAPASLLAASFEGKVSFRMTSGREKPMDITYNIKGDKLRVDIPMQNAMGGAIMDLGKREMIMLMPDQKMYMTMAIPEAALDAATNANDDVKLEKTSETEKILGHTATKYVATHEGTTTDMWLAEGIGAYMAFNNNNPMARGKRGSGVKAWERALAGKELFPLRVVGRDKGGKETFRMEATEVTKTTLPDSMFAPPAGYQKFDMGGMLKGLIPGVKQR